MYYLFDRGIVSMVAHRSPKPPVRVRVLLPLPFHFYSYFIFFEVIFIFKNFKFFYVSLIILTFFIIIFFIPIFSEPNYSFSQNQDSEILDFNPNGFVWPIPGYTKISSPFGKRTSPTTRCFFFSFWYRYSSPTWK